MNDRVELTPFIDASYACHTDYRGQTGSKLAY
jgi:hypothetical protein